MRPSYFLLRSCRCLVLTFGTLAAAAPAVAQIGLPGLPQLPGAGLPSRLGESVSLPRERLRGRLLDVSDLPRIAGPFVVEPCAALDGLRGAAAPGPNPPPA